MPIAAVIFMSEDILFAAYRPGMINNPSSTRLHAFQTYLCERVKFYDRSLSINDGGDRWL